MAMLVGRLPAGICWTLEPRGLRAMWACGLGIIGVAEALVDLSHDRSECTARVMNKELFTV